MTVVAVVYDSATGRTRALAEAVARGAGSVTAAGVSVTTHLFSAAEAMRAHDLLATADAIVFGSPTYMGSASAGFKAFMDATSAVWALQGWRDKLAAGFTHSAALSGDKLGTLTQLAVFAAQHGMVWIGLGLPPTYASAIDEDGETNRLGSHLGAMAQSRPGGGVLPRGDLETAEHLGRRVAKAAVRWQRGLSRSTLAPPGPERHETARSWSYPPADRPPPPPGVARHNLREIAARPDRFEHCLTICATVDDVQLEVTAASEPLYFAHINLSDEWAVALPTGDDLVDRFPLRTFLTDPSSGEDVARYNHRVGDLVLHPEGILHWPGRLRPPFDPFDFPPGMRRSGLSLVYCANKPTPPTWSPLPIPPGREGDAKVYVADGSKAPPMALASIRSAPGVLARIGRTSLSLVELPQAIAPAHGGWVIVLEAESGGPHAACDLLRLSEGASLDGAGIVRALVLASDAVAPDPVPPSWTATPAPPFVPYEDAGAGELPVEVNGEKGAALRVDAASPSTVTASIGAAATEVPRYWLARMLYRIGLHGLRLGYVETYGGFFVDDRDDAFQIGVRLAEARAAVGIPRGEAMALVERLYRAVAPPGYRERPR
ncbi:MAG: NAD(P)H-dependent oxidoreductase [Labilithrix sp.]|nr:NAD(P)H-dependent oxidoreductase [Labilithrix sp.]